MFSSELAFKGIQKSLSNIFKPFGNSFILEAHAIFVINRSIVSQALDDQHLQQPAEEMSLVKKHKKWQLWISDDG
jgi:hypothetical protein